MALARCSMRVRSMTLTGSSATKDRIYAAMAMASSLLQQLRIMRQCGGWLFQCSEGDSSMIEDMLIVWI